MASTLDSLTRDKRLMAWTAAAMYGGAALDGAVEGVVPGDPAFAVAPALAAAVIVGLLFAFGKRLPRWMLGALGPIGVGLVAAALATTPGAGDGAILYVWPVLWMAFFFGRSGALGILACIGAAHVVVLLAVPAASSFPARWIDVMVSLSVLALVILKLTDRNARLLARLADEARTDALTGLLNRRGFSERAELELARARRGEHSIAVVALDIDYFKRINDEWGHEIGDRVLTRFGELLGACSRDVDTVARLGGEEFVVLLSDSDVCTAEIYAERVRAALGAQNSTDLPTVRVSAGVHAAVAPPNVEGLLRAADSALYHAKRTGRDRTVLYDRVSVAAKRR